VAGQRRSKLAALLSADLASTPLAVPPGRYAVWGPREEPVPRAYYLLRALAAAGRNAVPATPAVRKALERGEPLASVALEVLATVRDAEILPRLVADLREGHALNRYYALKRIGDLGVTAQSAVPDLIGLVRGGNAEAAEALGALAARTR